MTGMDRWIAWNKGEFNGREAALAEREKKHRAAEVGHAGGGCARCGRLGLRAGVDRTGGRVGFVTSGGYGHHVGKSLAMALVDVEHAQVGEELHAHVVGVERGACIIASSPYDPDGAVMRR